ncbi:hypothetical protein RUM43_010126 [Polyplax serrata]|uniref:Uncharacterized protein n=1 Tax=Polyplax serrata TaxID=468196 RepID=A0AAN8PKY7_POLSC
MFWGVLKYRTPGKDLNPQQTWYFRFLGYLSGCWEDFGYGLGTKEIGACGRSSLLKNGGTREQSTDESISGFRNGKRKADEIIEGNQSEERDDTRDDAVGYGRGNFMVPRTKRKIEGLMINTMSDPQEECVRCGKVYLSSSNQISHGFCSTCYAANQGLPLIKDTQKTVLHDSGSEDSSNLMQDEEEEEEEEEIE